LDTIHNLIHKPIGTILLYSTQEIKQSLIDAGYKKNIIEHVFTKIGENLDSK